MKEVFRVHYPIRTCDVIQLNYPKILIDILVFVSLKSVLLLIMQFLLFKGQRRAFH